MTTVNRSECRWRGHDIEKVEGALVTGAPHFTANPGGNKCPVCGRRFKLVWGQAKECCSESCAGKLKMARRMA